MIIIIRSVCFSVIAASLTFMGHPINTKEWWGIMLLVWTLVFIEDLIRLYYKHLTNQ